MTADAGAAAKRRYDSPARRRQAEATRDRIIAVGAELARGLAAGWDWAELTFRAVAEAAGVSERTVYRNFPTVQHLHDAVMVRLEDDAGVTYDDVRLDNLAQVAGRVFASMNRFAQPQIIPMPPGPTFAGAGDRRREAILRAVADEAPGLSGTDNRAAAGLLDALWSPATYELLTKTWNLTDDEAIDAIAWLVGCVGDALRDDRTPSRHL